MESHIVTILKKFRGKDHVERNRLMAKFCKVNSETASHWGLSRLPKGGVLNKLWFFLSAHGFQISELESLNPTVQYVGKLLAYDVIGVEDALSIFSSKAHSHLWVVLQGGSVPLVVKKGTLTLDELKRLYDSRLESVRMAAIDKGLIPVQGQSKPSPSKLARAPAVIGKNTVLIVVTASLISSLKPLLRTVMDDKEGAEALREAVGSDNYHDVLDLLKAGASRKSYEFYHGQQEER